MLRCFHTSNKGGGQLGLNKTVLWTIEHSNRSVDILEEGQVNLMKFKEVI